MFMLIRHRRKFIHNYEQFQMGLFPQVTSLSQAWGKQCAVHAASDCMKPIGEVISIQNGQKVNTHYP